MKWITREHVKVDRVACPWLIKKFVDKDAEFIFVPADKVDAEARRLDAIPYDVKGVELGHHGKECSFEAILKKYKLTGDPALVLLGKIVNGADTDNTLYRQPEGPGLEAIAEGFRHLGSQDDPALNAAEPIDYDALHAYCRPWTLNGITPRLIESHYENNYGGALNRLNAIAEELAALDPLKTPAHVISRLKQDEMAALNSTLLHELYFASLGGDGRAPPDAMASALARDFGSVDRWRHEFVALANALAVGSGWVLLTWVPRDGRLINQNVSDTSQG